MDNINTKSFPKAPANTIFSLIRLLLVVALLLAFDQLVKGWATKNLKSQEPISIINGVFELTYLENQGSAWGLLKGKILFLILITIFVSALLFYFYNKIPPAKRFFPLRICFCLILSGAFGNLIDRLIYHHVIDMFYFKLINFPVFNVADIYITVGDAIFLILFLFVYKEEELSFWSFSKKSLN